MIGFNGLSLLAVLPLAIYITLALAVTIYGSPSERKRGDHE